MKEPVFRFKGYTDDWEQRKLGELGNFKNGMNFSKDAMDKGYPFVNLQNIFGRNVVDIDNLGLAEASDTQLKEYNLQEGDVLFVRSSVKLEGVGEAAIVPKRLENTTYSGFVIRFRDESDMDINYKRFVFCINPIRNQIMAKATNSANKNISQDVLTNLEICVPSKEEQRKIGEYFANLDNLIALNQRKCDALKELKKGMLQKMFPKDGEKVPEFRFKGFTGDWEQRKLRELAEFNPKSTLPDEFEYVDLESVVGTEIIAHRTEKKETAPSRAQRLAEQGDVFYQTVRPYQRNNCLFEGADEDYVFSTGYAQMRPHGDSYFLLTLLQKDEFVNVVLDRCTGTSYPAINSNVLAELTVRCPTNLDEQAKVGNYFKNIDNLITLHQRKCDALKELKKGFLQKMFI